MIDDVVHMFFGCRGVRVNGERCVVNCLSNGNVPEPVVFVYVPCHDNGTFVYDAAFVLCEHNLTSGVTHFCDGNE